MKMPLVICTATLLAFPLQAAVVEGDIVGTTDTDIRAVLLNDGYQINSIEFEDDEIEVEVLLDGIEFEMELSAITGAVVEIEAEEDKDNN